jgi:hypothetical protein
MKHTRLLAVLFGALTLACIVGCVKTANDVTQANLQPPPGNAAEMPPRAFDAPGAATVQAPEGPAKPWAEWVAESPMRQKMRSMWWACGLIVGNSYYAEYADVQLLRQAAENVATKSDAFAKHWEAVRDNNRRAAAAVNDNDWARVSEQLVETEQACEACHFENWSMATRGALGDTLKGWHDSDNVFEEEPWGNMNLNGAPTWINHMLRMRRVVRGTMFRARRLDKDAVLRGTREIHQFADDQARRWRLIEGQASAIGRAARRGALWEVQGHYSAMRNYCIECHARFAPDRGLAPMPWNG